MLETTIELVEGGKRLRVARLQRADEAAEVRLVELALDGRLLALEVEPGTFGRPSTIALFVAAEIALAQGAFVEIGDAAVVEGRGGGVRVSVTFPR